MVFKMVVSEEMFGELGAPLGGVTNAISIMIFNAIYGKVVEKLNHFGAHPPGRVTDTLQRTGGRRLSSRMP